MSKRILAVIRTSTIRQEIESQKKDIIEFCLSKGFTEEEIIFVVGFGASARKRNDKYLKMLEEIKTTIEKYHIKFVAVWHLNRLGRTEENLTALKEYFEQNKIQVYIKNPSLTLFNEDGTLNNGTSMSWTIFALMIKFETLELMEKLHRGREYRKTQNKYLGGKITYGYKVNESGYYEIDENESNVVISIFDMYSKGNIGASAIVAELTEKSIFARNGKPFSNIVISQILRNKDYFTNEKYPAIITEEQFTKCRSIASVNDFAVSKERSIYLGSKLLKCRNCGCSYSVNHQKHKNGRQCNSYLCNGYRTGHCKSEVNAIKMNVFDFCIKQVSLNMYSKILLTRSVTEKENINMAIIDNQHRLDNIKNLIAENDKKLGRLNRLYIEGRYLSYEDFENDYNKVNTEKTNLLSRKAELENRIRSLEGQLKLVSSSYSIEDWLNIRKSLLHNTDLAQMKEIVNLCISSAYLKKVELYNKSYTAIVIILNDDKETKKLYLFNRRSIFEVFADEMITSADNVFLARKYEFYKNDYRPSNIVLKLSKENYQNFIS